MSPKGKWYIPTTLIRIYLNTEAEGKKGIKAPSYTKKINENIQVFKSFHIWMSPFYWYQIQVHISKTCKRNQLIAATIHPYFLLSSCFFCFNFFFVILIIKQRFNLDNYSVRDGSQFRHHKQALPNTVMREKWFLLGSTFRVFIITRITHILLTDEPHSILCYINFLLFLFLVFLPPSQKQHKTFNNNQQHKVKLRDRRNK